MNVLWALSEIRTPFFNEVFQFITYVGQELILLPIICAVYWCLDKKLATLMSFSYASTGIVVQVCKITFRIPRPWVLDPDFKAVESAVPAATGYSFPSGHTQGTTSVFAVLAFYFKKWYAKAACIAFFLLVGFSRMYLGCHTPKDVGLGLTIGLVAAFLLWKYQKVFTEGSHSGLITCIVIIAAALLCVYAFYLHSTGVIEAKYVYDGFRSSGMAIGFVVGWYLERKYVKFSTDFANSNKGMLVIRFLIGYAVLRVMEPALDMIVGELLIGEMITYGLMFFWIMFLYPFLFTKLAKNQKTA